MNYLRGNSAIFAVILLLSSGILIAEDLFHVVEKGQTVYSISRMYRISQEELMKYNNITDASKVPAGMRLKIPGKTVNTPVETQPFFEYRIVSNDTLYSIARNHGITLQALLNINGFSANQVIKPGDKIKIPGSQATVTAQSPVTPPLINDSGSSNTKTIDPSIRWPVKAKEITYMTGRFNYVLVQGEHSEPVRSLTHGTVRSAQPFHGYGRMAIVETTGGYLYVYGGCESLSVKEGDKISPGMELGRLGTSEKPQLFFMVTRNNIPIDPAKAPRA